jgi:hypothetical protein
LPPLIADSNLLTFVSRRHVGSARDSALREVPFAETTMRRKFAVTYRRQSYLSPAAARVLGLLRSRGEKLFREGLRK